MNSIENRKLEVSRRLSEKNLDQIAEWISALPDRRWEEAFISRWPALAKECGAREAENAVR